jgi:adenosylhomocysteine nucleosidase
LRWNGFAQHRGRWEGQEVLVSKSGVGEVMAAMMTQRLLEIWKPKAVIFTGLAGSLRAHIDFGEMLLAIDLVQPDCNFSCNEWRGLS